MAVSGLGGQTCQSQLTEANPPASICWWLFCSPAKHMLKRVVLQMTVGVCGVNQPKLMLAVLIWHKNPGQNQKPLQERNDYLNYQLISVSFSSTRPDITFSGNSLKLFFSNLSARKLLLSILKTIWVYSSTRVYSCTCERDDEPSGNVRFFSKLLTWESLSGNQEHSNLGAIKLYQCNDMFGQAQRGLLWWYW